MKQYLCTRYPVDKKHGGVSRAWLLDQRNVARYPNLLVEIALHPAPPALIAIKSGVTEDVLIDILLGNDSIGMQEACLLREAMRTDIGYPSYDYVFGHELDCDNTCEEGDCLKDARRDARKLKGKHPAIPLLKEILKEENPPHAAVMILDSYRDYMRPEYERRVQITPRLLPLQVWEDYEESRPLSEAEIEGLKQQAAEDLLIAHMRKQQKGGVQYA